MLDWYSICQIHLKSHVEQFKLHIYIKIILFRFRSLATAFFRNAMGFVLVYDITNPQSFINVRDWLEQLRTHAYSYDPVVILVGNKSDLAHERKIEKGDAERLAVKSGLDYIETSARSGENVGEAMEKLLDIVWEKMMKNIPALGDPELHSLVPCESVTGTLAGQIITDADMGTSSRKGCCGK